MVALGGGIHSLYVYISRSLRFITGRGESNWAQNTESIFFKIIIEFFLMKMHSVDFFELSNVINHWRMNCDPFKCSLCYLCLCGALLAPLTLKQEVVNSNTTFYKFYHKFCRILQNLIRENSIGLCCDTAYISVFEHQVTFPCLHALSPVLPSDWLLSATPTNIFVDGITGQPFSHLLYQSSGRRLAVSFKHRISILNLRVIM